MINIGGVKSLIKQTRNHSPRIQREIKEAAILHKRRSLQVTLNTEVLILMIGIKNRFGVRMGLKI